MKKFVFYINNAWMGGIVMFTVFFAGVVVLGKYFKGANELLNLALACFLVMVTTITSFLISKAKIEIRLTDTVYQHIWIDRFLFDRTPNVEIKLENIVRFYTTYSYLKKVWTNHIIEMTDGRKYEISRIKIWPWAWFKDDYKEFVKEMESALNDQ